MKDLALSYAIKRRNLKKMAIGGEVESPEMEAKESMEHEMSESAGEEAMEHDSLLKHILARREAAQPEVESHEENLAEEDNLSHESEEFLSSPDRKEVIGKMLKSIKSKHFGR